MDVLVIHLLNALLYASVLFLIAGGLSLIYGVMRIVNMAHGNLYAFGAYVTAWAIGSVAAGGPAAPPLGVPPPGGPPPAPVRAAPGATPLPPLFPPPPAEPHLLTLPLLMLAPRQLGGAIIVPGQSAVLGMGIDAVVLAFIVVVVGGLGSLEGALVGALIVGVVREAGITWFPEIELAVLYLIAAIVLLIRPAGLFGRP